MEQAKIHSSRCSSMRSGLTRASLRQAPMDLAFISPSVRDNRIMTSTSTVSRGLLGSANCYCAARRSVYGSISVRKQT